MNDKARDLTQAERVAVFGTSDDRQIVAICEQRKINHCVRKNIHFCIVTVWRSHLPDDMEQVLADNERHGVVYVGGERLAA